MKFLALFICCLSIEVIPTEAEAFRLNRSTYFIGVGGMGENVKRFSNNAAADSTSLTGTSYVNLVASAFWPLGLNLLSTGWYLSPAITFTPLGLKSPDGGETDRLLSLQVRFDYEINNFDMRLGPGLFQKMISGSGGTVSLNNGLGTSTFAFPPQGANNTLIDWDAGVGYTLNSFRLDLDFLVTDVLTSRRAVNGMFTVSYGLF